MSAPLQIVSVIAVIKNRKNQYLLVQRSKDDDIFPLKWQNMGGKIELGEKVEEALAREIKEEVGINLPTDFNPTFLQSYSWKKDENSDVRLGLIFLIELDGELKIEISEELNSYGWFTYSEAEKLDSIGMDSPTGTLAQIRKADNHLS